MIRINSIIIYGPTIVDWIWKVCHLGLNIFWVLCKHLSNCETWTRHCAEAAPCFQFSWFYENWGRGTRPSSGLQSPVLCSVSTPRISRAKAGERWVSVSPLVPLLRSPESASNWTLSFKVGSNISKSWS